MPMLLRWAMTVIGGLAACAALWNNSREDVAHPMIPLSENTTITVPTPSDCGMCPVSWVSRTPLHVSRGEILNYGYGENRPLAVLRNVCSNYYRVFGKGRVHNLREMLVQVLPEWEEPPRGVAGNGVCCTTPTPILVAPMTYTMGHNPVHTFFDGYFSFWVALFMAVRGAPPFSSGQLPKVMTWLVPNDTAKGTAHGGAWLRGFLKVALMQHNITELLIMPDETSTECHGERCVMCTESLLVPRKVGSLHNAVQGVPGGWEAVSSDIKAKFYKQYNLHDPTLKAKLVVAYYGREGSRRLLSHEGSDVILPECLRTAMAQEGLGGLKIVHKMPATFREQVELFSTFDVYITIGGANEQNALFMPHGSTILHFIRCTFKRSFLSRYIRPDQHRVKLPLCSRRSPVNRTATHFGITCDGFLYRFGVGLFPSLNAAVRTRYKDRARE